MWVKILRNTYVASEVIPAGREVELDHFMAKLLIGAGKAKAIPEPAKPEPVKASKPKPAPAEPAAPLIEESTDGN